MAIWSDGVQRGTRAAQPAAGTVSDGVLYYVTDESILERNNAGTWEQVAVGGTGALDFGEAGDITTIAWGDSPAAGATGEVADAGHTHGAPSDPSISVSEDGSGGTSVDPVTAIVFGGDIAVSDDGGGQVTITHAAASSLEVREDGSGGTQVSDVATIVFTGDITVTDDGSGQVTVAHAAGGSLTVGEDGSGGTSVADVDTILIDGATVTDDGGGQVTITIVGGGSSGTGVLPQSGDNYELAYVEDTDGATVSATTDATADTVMTLPEFTVDGSTPVVIDVSLRALGNGTAGDRVWFSLWEGSSDLGRLMTAEVGDEWWTGHTSVRFTPSAGAHTYIIKAWMSGTGPITVTSGAGGTATYYPMYARARLANPTVNNTVESVTTPNTLQVILDSPAVDDNIDLIVPFPCTIVGWKAKADQSGSITVDIWKGDTLADDPTNSESITASAPVDISSDDYGSDSSLTGWTTSLLAGEVLRFNVDSVTDITRLVIALEVEAADLVQDDTVMGVVLDSPAASDQVDVIVPYECTIISAIAFADVAGDVEVDVWVDDPANGAPTDADSITASAPIALSSAIYSEDTTLTGWTTDLAAGRVVRFNVDSTATLGRVFVGLKVRRSLPQTVQGSKYPDGEGSSFPASPTSGMTYRRTDLNNEVFRYDGTRWLSETLYTLNPFFTDAVLSATDAAVSYIGLDSTHDIYLERAVWGALWYGTQDGSNYWECEISKRTVANVEETITNGTTTSDVVAGGTTWETIETDIGQVVDVSTHPALQFGFTKVGSAGNVIPSVIVYYRRVAA